LQGYAGYDDEFKTERGSLKSVFENIQRLLGTAITSEESSLVFESDGSSALFEVPFTLITEIVLPMVINALQSVTSDPTPVLLKSSLTEQELLIEVSDLGIGMDEETQSHIFEPFYSSRELYESKGLGLSRVKGLVDFVGGRIEVKSNKPKGTSFLVSLPINKLEQLSRDEQGGWVSG
jgi:signal transduction histidine kinase